MSVDSKLLLIIKSNGIGEGEPDLGERLMGSFLKMLLEGERLPARMIFMNAGVFLTTEGSPHLETLARLEEAGTDIASCGTCLDYYGRREHLAVGRPGDMRETVRSMLEHDTVRVF